MSPLKTLKKALCLENNLEICILSFKIGEKYPQSGKALRFMRFLLNWLIIHFLVVKKYNVEKPFLLLNYNFAIKTPKQPLKEPIVYAPEKPGLVYKHHCN